MRNGRSPGYDRNMLTKADIHFILEKLAEKTVVEPTSAFPYRISHREGGYSTDRQIGALQAKLSIMLEAAQD